MSPSEQPKVVERFCVVCGQGSHRSDWAASPSPACDSHSETEVREAVARSRGAKSGSKAEESKPQTRAAAVTE